MRFAQDLIQCTHRRMLAEAKKADMKTAAVFNKSQWFLSLYEKPAFPIGSKAMTGASTDRRASTMVPENVCA